jgi:hypothetical protein
MALPGLSLYEEIEVLSTYREVDIVLGTQSGAPTLTTFVATTVTGLVQ